MTTNQQRLALLGKLAAAVDNRNSKRADNWNNKLVYQADSLTNEWAVDYGDGEEVLNNRALTISKLLKKGPK